MTRFDFPATDSTWQPFLEGHLGMVRDVLVNSRKERQVNLDHMRQLVFVFRRCRCPAPPVI